MTGTGIQAGITANPSTVAFGNVAVSSSSSQTVTLSNPGNTALTISALTASGTGYSVNGFTLPIAIAAGANTTINAQFAPTTTGSSAGSISITSNAPGSPTTIAMSGTGTQPVITPTPSSVAFGNVTIGSPNSQTVQIKNTGTGTLTIAQATASGTGFSISGLTLPANINAGGNTTFTVTFAPNATGAVSGSVSLTNNSASTPFSIPLSGTGVAATLILNSSTNSLAFGSVSTAGSSSLNVTLTNAGNASVTVSSVTVSGTGAAAYSTSGVTSGLSITAGGTATLAVKFAPTSATSFSGTVTVASNATNSPVSVTLTGTGVQPVQHTVALSWTASTSTVVGYKVYRSTTSGGPYTLLTSTPVAATSYTDSTVQSGVTYFYVVTSVDSSGNESVFSNEASTTVPTP
jgi:hypothetical protein